MAITAEQLAKLPKYAQDHIADLARIIEGQRAQLATLTGDPETTDTIANPYASQRRNGSQAVALEKGETVQFTLGEGRGSAIRAQILDRGQGRALEINGDYALNVKLGSSNLIYVTIADH